MTVILDTCTFAHFLGVAEERIITEYASRVDAEVAVTRTVAGELDGVLRNRPAFRGTGAFERWQYLRDSIKELPEDVTGDVAFARAVSDLHRADLDYRGDLSARLGDPKDLGEFMTVAHALRLARSGTRVIVLVDDSYGRRLVNIAKQLLLREERDFQLIVRSHVRDLVSKMRSEGAEATIARMEQVQSVPRWPA